MSIKQWSIPIIVNSNNWNYDFVNIKSQNKSEMYEKS